MPSVEELQQQLAEAQETERRQRHLSTQSNIQTFPNPAAVEVEQNPYAANTWGSNEFDFRTPSGQLCRMKKLDLTELAEAGILDKMTRLPGIAGELVAKAEGAPPSEPLAADALPQPEQIRALVEVVNVLVPMVVIAPQVWPLPEGDETKKPERIYVDSIDIGDRVAIMERSLRGLNKLDSFRTQS